MENKIVIDVLTLDSVQCAACGYMMESIAALPQDVQDMIDLRVDSIISNYPDMSGKLIDAYNATVE